MPPAGSKPPPAPRPPASRHARQALYAGDPEWTRQVRQLGAMMMCWVLALAYGMAAGIAWTTYDARAVFLWQERVALGAMALTALVVGVFLRQTLFSESLPRTLVAAVVLAPVAGLAVVLPLVPFALFSWLSIGLYEKLLTVAVILLAEAGWLIGARNRWFRRLRWG